MAPLRIRSTMHRGERLQLSIHHLDDEARTAVWSLVRAHLPLQGRLAGGEVAERPSPLASMAASSAQRRLTLVTSTRASRPLNVSE